jgi:hypothetical protein
VCDCVTYIPHTVLSCSLPETGHANIQRELLVRLADIEDTHIDERKPVRLIRLECDDRLGPSIGTELKIETKYH